MKEVNVCVPFFINNDNMEYHLKGCVIDNLEDIHKNLFKDNMNLDVYEPRSYDLNHPNTPIGYDDDVTEYPNQSDIIKARVLRYIKNSNGHDCLEIQVLDSLYYHKLKEPCIKLNGYCTIQNNTVHIEKITRITLADRNTFGLINNI